MTASEILALRWFDNLWNNSNWILAGMIVMITLQLVTIYLWEYHLKGYLEKQKDSSR